MPVKKKDFIEIEYTGKTKEDNIIFDTTSEEVAKKNNIHSEYSIYGPVVICVGEGQLLKGLDHKIEGKEIGEYTFDLKAEEAFGKKNAKLIRLVPISKFKEQGIKPEQGMQLNIDGTVSTIKSVSGGRVLVDFNHPLSGRDLVYDIVIKRMVGDKKEQIMSLLSVILSIGKKDAEVDVKEGEAKIKIKKKGLPKEVLGRMAEEIKRLVSGIKKVDITPLE
jgi:FKBP-type peptidyl-prolyl cis-trans isomerase SlyD